MTWQPIDTAPKDGTEVLVYAAEYPGDLLVDGEPLPAFITICAYHADAGWCVCELREVTAWMPLPEPPK